MKAQIKEVIQRVQAESPTHFKRFANFGYVLIGLGILGKAACLLFPATIPIGIAGLAADIIWLGAGISGTAITSKK
jgi:hypothetical protein